ncbi:MAG: hypothetical protein RBS80_10875 [Thermoguttaceae bacterium]|jgi:hypothetical protein|nr:hypothetical protein [Thermoguttaceae bacterium]
MQRVFFFGTALVLACGAAQVGSGREPGSAPIDVGSRLELFVDEHLVDKREGDARLHLHKPQPKLICRPLAWRHAGSGDRWPNKETVCLPSLPIASHPG